MKKKLLIIFGICITLIACNQEKSEPINNILSEEENNGLDQVDTIKDELKPMKLDFQPVKLVKLELLDEDRIKNVKEINLNEYIINVYNKKEINEEIMDEGVYYAGIKIKGCTYEIGEAGYGSSDMIDADIVNVNDIEYIRISGGLGAAYPVEYYLKIEDGVPTIHIYQELPVYIEDIDNDGIIEWISEYGGQVTIYKEQDGLWFYVRLHDEFDYVYYDRESNNFNVVMDRGKENQTINTYILSIDTLIPAPTY